MYLALIILPILGSIMSGFFGRKIGVKGAQLITCSCVIITTTLAILGFLEVGFNNIPTTIHLFRWIDSESLSVSWAFNFDSLTVSMLIPVLIVSSLVHVYSIGYMSHDPHNQRFFSYLSLFTFMMIILVTADNFLLMFVGWEGVGVCSYLLVSFWFTRIAANQSSLSAFLTNRVGDCLLTIGMFAILFSFGDINYFTVFSLSPYFSETVIIVIGVCLLIGAMAKSSQVGLHVWLPMAIYSRKWLDIEFYHSLVQLRIARIKPNILKSICKTLDVTVEGVVDFCTTSLINLYIFNYHWSNNSYSILELDSSRLYMEGSGSEETSNYGTYLTEKLNKLEEKKKELEEIIKENEKTLKDVENAEDLDDRLPPQIRDKNHYLNKIKKEFGVYFDEDSGNTILEGLDEVRGHLEQDQSETRAQLDDIDNDIIQLQTELTPLPSSKRKASEIKESETKRSRNDDNDGSDDSGSGSLPPSAPSSSSPATGSNAPSFKVECDSVNKPDDNKLYYTKIILDIIISVLDAISEDDHFKD